MPKPKLSPAIQALQDRQEKKRRIREQECSVECGVIANPKLRKVTQIMMEGEQNGAKHETE